MKPREGYRDDWTRMLVGDAAECAKTLRPGSVGSIVTSPPYWSLRSYLPSDHQDKANEIGAEPTPEAWVENLVAVFGALRSALHDSGTLWVVVGDAYCDKQLLGLPFALAFALRTDGWYWRSNTTWCKKNAMPESVRDRPSVATEQVLMFSKNPRYFFDQEAVREHHQSGRNIRNWWVINPRPYPGSHYATFPPDLVYPMIKAGTSEKGSCIECGAPWERVTQKGKLKEHSLRTNRAMACKQFDSGTYSVQKTGTLGMQRESLTVAWKRSCSCVVAGSPPIENRAQRMGWNLPDPVPATVLDPFMGSGTTALAARSLGRRSVGFDLDERNAALVEERMGHQQVLL